MLNAFAIEVEAGYKMSEFSRQVARERAGWVGHEAPERRRRPRVFPRLRFRAVTLHDRPTKASPRVHSQSRIRALFRGVGT